MVLKLADAIEDFSLNTNRFGLSTGCSTPKSSARVFRYPFKIVLVDNTSEEFKEKEIEELLY